MKAIRTAFVLFGGSIVAGLAVGAFVSKSYWGFAFVRPVTTEALETTRVASVVDVTVSVKSGRCVLELDADRDFKKDASNARPYIREFPSLRALVLFDDRGLLPSTPRPPAGLDPSALCDSLAEAGAAVGTQAGYDIGVGFGGDLFELDLGDGRTRVLLMGGGPEISNDHHPCWEVVFRRDGARLVQERMRVTYYDIAGIEGFEWPLMHTFFVVVCLAIAAVGALVLAIAKALARWVARRRTAAGA